MNVTKKIVVVSLSIAMLLCAFPVGAFATTNAVAEGENSNTDDLNDWLLYDCYYEEAKGHFVLTEDNTSWETGAIWYNQPCNGDFTLEMDYYTGSSDRSLGGADGIVVAFYANKSYTMSGGEELGFSGCGGYGVELDTYRNGNQGDPSYNHIGLIKEDVGNHLVTADLSAESEDEQWHHLKVVVENNTCFAYVDGMLKFSQSIEKTGYGQIGITSATGDGHNLHAVKNISITYDESSLGSSVTEKYLNIQLFHERNYDYYIENNNGIFGEYTITAEIINNAEFVAENVVVTLAVEGEADLHDGYSWTQSIGDLQSQERKTLTWVVNIKFENNSTVHYGATAIVNDIIKIQQENDINVGKSVCLSYFSGNKSISNNATYSDSYFEKNTEYNHDLAWLTLCLELSSWTADESNWDDGILYDENNVKPNTDSLSRNRYKNIENAYAALDFEESYFYNYNVTLNDTSDKVAFSIATKKDVCGATLIAVVIRGGGYGAEWGSNLNMGNGSSYHEGFYNAAKAVYKKVIDDPDYPDISGDIKFWVTGYSRGAAVANIFSAMLCNESEKSNQFDKEDVFAYTFATPQGVTNDNNVSDVLYQNIYNIVNPGDIVPLVAPSGWGFARYGTTKLFSPLTHFSNNINTNCYSTVNQNYLEIKQDIFDAEANLEQESLNKALLNIITRAFPNAGDSQKIQKVLQEFLEFTNTKEANEKNISAFDFQTILRYRYGDKYLFAYGAATIAMTYNSEARLLSILNYDYVYLILTLAELHDISANEMFDLINSIVFSIDTWDDLSNAEVSIEKFKSIFVGHYPEVYLSWMKQSEYQAFGFVKTLTTTVMSIACPVNVTVYDESGNVIASIVNHEVISAEIPVIVNGETTEIYFSSFSDEDYTVEIVATDNGTMNYTVTELNVAGETVKRANYYDVQLETNQKFTSNVEALTDFTDEKYDLLALDGETETIISASEILSSGEGNVTLDVNISGEGTVVGSGNYIKGDSINLKAYAAKGYVFAGWYLEDQFISDENTCLIRILEDTEINAVFNVCEHTWNTGEITKQPTHTEYGEITYVCTTCNDIKTEQLEKVSSNSSTDKRDPNDSNQSDTLGDKNDADIFDVLESIPKETIIIVGALIAGVILLVIICVIVKKKRF